MFCWLLLTGILKRSRMRFAWRASLSCAPSPLVSPPQPAHSTALAWEELRVCLTRRATSEYGARAPLDPCLEKTSVASRYGTLRRVTVSVCSVCPLYRSLTTAYSSCPAPTTQFYETKPTPRNRHMNQPTTADSRHVDTQERRDRTQIRDRTPPLTRRIFENRRFFPNPHAMLLRNELELAQSPCFSTRYNLDVPDASRLRCGVRPR